MTKIFDVTNLNRDTVQASEEFGDDKAYQKIEEVLKLVDIAADVIMLSLIHI